MTKTCSLCKTEQPIEHFAIRNRSKMTYQSWCKPCKQVYESEHYRKNAKRREQIKNQGAKAQAKARIWLLDYISDKFCVDCGERDLVVLEFDHRDPKTKSASISNMISAGLSVKRIEEEIQKCDVRCANCHRRRTAAQFGWWKSNASLV